MELVIDINTAILEKDRFKEEVLKLELKPYSLDRLQIGEWCIASHSCGYFMLSKSGYRFNFDEKGIDHMLDLVIGILNGSLGFVTHLTGTGGLWHQGNFYKCSITNADHAGDYFSKALKQCDFDVKHYGQRLLTYDHFYAAIVAL